MSVENPAMPSRDEPPGLPVPAPNPKFTIQESRLAGSVGCMNCGTDLMGPFCHYCGQPDKNLMRFFPALLREFLEDFLDFDSRFMRTLKPLLFKPGKLTRDYLDGRRFRYVPPLRLYIFSSIALFFLFAVFAGSTLQFEASVDPDNPNLSIHLDSSEQAELQEALKELEKVQPGMAEQIAGQIEEAQNAAGEAADGAAEEAAEDGHNELDEIQFDVKGKPWHPETNPLTVPLMPDWINDWLNREIAESPQKGKAIGDNPNLMVDKVLDVLPATMFVLLPLVALLLKIWYLFAKKYYVEHLIFALHNHAFIFVMLLVMVILGVVTEWREPDGQGPVTQAAEWTKIAILCWIPVYLLVSLKRVYRQGWGLTLAKYSAIGVSYLVLLSFVTVFTAVLSFVLL